LSTASTCTSQETLRLEHEKRYLQSTKAICSLLTECTCKMTLDFPAVFLPVKWPWTKKVRNYLQWVVSSLLDVIAPQSYCKNADQPFQNVGKFFNESKYGSDFCLRYTGKNTTFLSFSEQFNMEQKSHLL